MTALVFCVVLVALSLVLSLFVPIIMRAQAWRQRPSYLAYPNEVFGFTIETSRHIPPGTAIVIGRDALAMPYLSEPLYDQADPKERWMTQFRMEQRIAMEVRLAPDPRAMVIITGIS